MSDDFGTGAWVDPARPPAWGTEQVKIADTIWATWLDDDPIHPNIWHWCDHNVWLAKGGDPDLCKPRWALAGTRAHEVVQRKPLTLSPSLLWSGCCNGHGFIRNGQWVPA